MEFTPPLSVNLVILLLLGLSNGDVWGVDTKTNSVNIKFSIGNSIIDRLVCSLKWIIITSQNSIKYYKLPYLKEIQHHDLNIFVNKQEEMSFDSDIKSIEVDHMTSEGMVLTGKGNLYCLIFEENAAVRLYSVIEEKNKIIQAKILTKDYQFYSLRNIDYDKLEIEQTHPEMKENNYYFVTAHKGGVIKIWSIPEYSIHLNFEVVNEEVICFDTTSDLKLAVSYSTGIIRFFDINKESFMGKYSSISCQPYKFIKFLPDGEYMFTIDFTNTLYLMRIEKYEPILIQVHQLFNVAGDIFDFKLNFVEQYNKFLLNVQNVYLLVYNRKFTNILKNLSYESSIPIFYVQDKFNPDEYLKSLVGIENNRNNGKLLHENFHYEFSPNIEEKSLIYILSEGRKLILIRNFENHTIIKYFNFNQRPTTFSISENFAFKAVLFNDFIQVNPVSSDNTVCTRFNLPAITTKFKNIQISPNGKFIAIYEETNMIFCNVKYI